MSDSNQRLVAAQAKANAYEQQLVQIGCICNGDATDCVGDDKSIAGLVRERLAAAEGALKTEYCLDVDNPLFEGLVGGSLGVGTLLATLHRVKKQRDEARTVVR
jgi:hypothetical protein